MKKAMIAIISVLYAVAIIVVGFLGPALKVYDTVVPVEKIVLNIEEGTTKIPGKEDKLFEIYRRPEDLSSSPAGLQWDVVEDGVTTKKRDYIVRIFGFNYFIDSLEGVFDLKAECLPDNASNKGLTFHVPHEMEDVVSVKDGRVIYSKVNVTTTFDLIITSNDNQDIKLDIQFVAKGYVE